MKARYLLSVSLFLFICSATNTYAQDAEEEVGPKKFENVTWHVQGFVKVDPAKLDSVKTYLQTIYLPAAEEVGLNAEIYMYATGKWNLMLFVELENGPSDLEWEIPPTAPAMMELMAEKAEDPGMLQRINSFVVDFENHVVMKLKSQ